MSTETIELIQKAAQRVETVEAEHRKSKDTIRDLDVRVSELETKGAVIHGGDAGSQPASISTIIRKSAGFADYLAGRTKTARFPLDGLELKSILTSTALPSAQSPSATYDVQSQRHDGLWGHAYRPTRLIDVLPRLPMPTSNSFEFIELSGYSNAAAEQTAEGGTKAEANVHTALSEAKVATIAHWLPVSRQLLSDAPGLEQALRQLLLHGLADKLERLLVSGSGTIQGLWTQGATYAYTGQYRVDCLGEAIAYQAGQGYTPSFVLMNPTDWGEQQRRKDSEGRYLIGDPSQPAPPSLWGVPVIPTAAATAGQWLVVDTTKVLLLDRMAAIVEIGYSGTQFTENAATMLAEVRAGLAVLDSAAVLKLSFTGSPSPE